MVPLLRMVANAALLNFVGFLVIITVSGISSSQFSELFEYLARFYSCLGRHGPCFFVIHVHSMRFCVSPLPVSPPFPRFEPPTMLPSPYRRMSAMLSQYLCMCLVFCFHFRLLNLVIGSNFVPCLSMVNITLNVSRLNSFVLHFSSFVNSLGACLHGLGAIFKYFLLFILFEYACTHDH